MWYPRSVYRVFHTLQARQRGERHWPRRFTSRLTHPMPSWRAVQKLMLGGGMRADLSDAGRIPVTEANELPALPAGQTSVTWIGHATCVIRMGGVTVLTDPVWSRRIPGVKPRLTPPGVPLQALGHIDAVVISHNHFDHLDAPTIKRLPRDTLMLVPGGLAWWFHRLGFRQVTELDWWETAAIGPVRAQFVPGHHWSRRTPFDGCASLWGGWVLTADENDRDQRRVYFAGDTAYGPYLTEIGDRCPGIDLALLPVGAFLPRWFMKPLHMNPAEAVRACADLGAARMATIHWGTFALSAETPMAPIEQARQAWAGAGRPREDLWDLSVGETRVLLPAAAPRS
jgi:L-ascorbate metabolism protein UlaG (beta-lactamase superfamily)